MRERERESEVLLCSVVACAYNNKIRVDDEIRREDEKQKTEYSVGKENGPTTQTLYLSLYCLPSGFLSSPHSSSYLPL